MALTKRLFLLMLTLTFSQGHAATWEELCGDDGKIPRQSAVVPEPNYSHPLIKQAADKLNKIVPDSFWLYSDIEKVYGLCSGRKKKTGKCLENLLKPRDVKVHTDNVLTILCGEYRDNRKMFFSKLKWITDISIVEKKKQGYDPSKNPWEQLTSEGYHQLIRFSQSLYYARKKRTENVAPYLTLEQESISALTTCEYRYILAEYLSYDESFDQWKNPLDVYQMCFKAFKDPEDSEQIKGCNVPIEDRGCHDEEEDFYNEFRGDGNFKPQSLESNAFIWNSRIFAKNCKTTLQARKGTVLSDSDCEGYFSTPFSSRYELARQGLLRLFFYPKQDAKMMRDYKGSLVFVTEDVNADGIADMIVLDRSLQGKLDGPQEKGADLLIELRSKIKELRTERIWGLAKVYGNILHYVSLKSALYQLPLDLASRPRLVTVMGKAELKIKALFERWSKDVDKFERDQNKLLGMTDGSNEYQSLQSDLKKRARRIVKLKKEKKQLQEIIVAKEYKGIVLRTEVHESWDPDFMSLKDKGLAMVSGDVETAWDRIATVLDRHTDWYKIDMMNLSLGFYQPTFSPWVASSYYIHKSDPFTKPGYAMNLPGDGHRHWMYIQKVRKDRWFKASNLKDSFIKDGKLLDLENTWFDETTFSRSHLGADEQGWDRFGSPTADEIGYNLWLYEIK